MRYFFITLFIFTLFFGTALAGDGSFSGWVDLSYQRVGDFTKHIFGFVKQKADALPRKVENKTEEILENTRDAMEEKAEKAAEDIKQGINEMIESKTKKIFWGITNNLKTKVFNPLKIKIQQGRVIIRDRVEQAKDYLFN